MIFTETPLAGAFVIEPEPKADERGFFARMWCTKEFEANGLDARLVQASVAYNRRAGTLRGMHYQRPPFGEVKIARCTRGAIFDAIVDLRPGSRTFGKHFGVVLSAENHRMLYVPCGFAQGYQTLEDHTEVLYQMSEFYRPESAEGVRWNDPAFDIEWPPVETRIIAARDAAYPDFRVTSPVEAR